MEAQTNLCKVLKLEKEVPGFNFRFISFLLTPPTTNILCHFSFQKTSIINCLSNILLLELWVDFPESNYLTVLSQILKIVLIVQKKECTTYSM